MRLASTIAVLLAWLCAAGVATGGASASGIDGRVVSGPTCPVERVPPQPGCAPRPLVASLRIRAVGSRARPTLVRSAADGRFRVRLAPAEYIVQALAVDRSGLPRPPAPLKVQVRKGRFAHLTVAYDTGIR